MRTRRIALVVPGLEYGGGVPAVARFLHARLNREPDYRAELISLAVSSSDPASAQWCKPATWFSPARVRTVEWEGQTVPVVGAWGSEFELQRLRPRRWLDDMLRGFDLVHVVCGTPAWACPIGDFGRPVVVHAATTAASERAPQLLALRGPRRVFQGLINRAVSRCDRLGTQRADIALAMNRGLLATMQTWKGGAERVDFAPPGIDTEFYRPTSNPSRDYLLCVGRLRDPRKNVRMLLEVFVALKANGRMPLRLVLAGLSAPAPADLAFIRDNGCAGDIEVRVGASAEEVAELHRHAFAFVLPSDEEGYGMVLLEAMASGRPVISTNCGGPGDIVENAVTGFLTRVADAEQFSERLSALIADPTEAERMGRAGRERVLALFSHDAAIGAVHRTYRSLLGSKNVAA